MIKIKSVISKIVLFSGVSLLFSSSAFAANGTMNYNGINAVPTLSGTMLLVLSLLLFVVAMRVAKNKSGNKLFIMTTGLTAILLGAGGVKVVSEVQAGSSPVSHLDGSGTVNIPASVLGVDYYYFANEDFPGGITISSIVAGPGSACGEDFIGRVSVTRRPPPTDTTDYTMISDCAAGLSLGIEQACRIACGPIGED